MTPAELIQIIASTATLVAAIGTLLMSYRNSTKIEAVHLATNSMKDELVRATASASKAEGLEQGRAEQRQP
jgi:hypothetical protein